MTRIGSGVWVSSWTSICVSIRGPSHSETPIYCCQDRSFPQSVDSLGTTRSAFPEAFVQQINSTAFGWLAMAQRPRRGRHVIEQPGAPAGYLRAQCDAQAVEGIRPQERLDHAAAREND